MTIPKIEVRRSALSVERLFHDTGPASGAPLRRGVIVNVLRNPFAGRYEPNLIPWMDSLRPFATAMARELLDALGGDASAIETYGKGAMVGPAASLSTQRYGIRPAAPACAKPWGRQWPGAGQSEDGGRGRFSGHSAGQRGRPLCTEPLRRYQHHDSGCASRGRSRFRACNGNWRPIACTAWRRYGLRRATC